MPTDTSHFLPPPEPPKRRRRRGIVRRAAGAARAAISQGTWPKTGSTLLSEVGAYTDQQVATVQTALDSHRNATTGAHAASAISLTPSGTVASTTVQAGIIELAGEKVSISGSPGVESIQITDSTTLAGLVSGGTTVANRIYFAPTVPGGTGGGGGGVTYKALDNFNRTVTDGLGTAETGGNWATTGGTIADFDVNGTAMTMNIGTVGGARAAVLTGNLSVDTTATAGFLLTSMPVGGNMDLFVYARYVSSNDFFRCRCRVTPAGVLTVLPQWATAASATDIGAAATVSGLTVTANTEFRVEFATTGTGPTNIAVRAWLASGTRPSTPNISTTTTSGPTAAGGSGVAAQTGTGMTVPFLTTVPYFDTV